MRLTATSESISFLGAVVGSIRPRALSPLFGGSSPFIPLAVGATAVGAAAVMATGALGAIKVCLVAVVVAWAIGASTSAAAGSRVFVASALAWASASKQDTVTSQ